MNDRLLRVTAIFAVLALLGVATAVGAVAAQEDFEVDDLNVQVGAQDSGPDAQVVDSDELVVSATVNNNGTAAGTQDIEFRLNATDEPLDGDAVVETVEDVELNESESTEVEFLSGATTDDLDLLAGSYDHGVFSENDSAEGLLEVAELADGANIEGDIRQRISGTQDFSVIDGATERVGIRIINDDTGLVQEPNFADADIVDEDTGIWYFTPAQDDEYDRAVPVFGDNTTYTVEAAVFEQNETTGEYSILDDTYRSDAGTVEDVEPGTTRTQSITLVREIQAGDIDVEQSANSAIADGQDSITFNVQVFDDINFDPFQDNVEIDIDAEDDAAVGLEVLDGPDEGVTFSGDQDDIVVGTDDEGRVNLSTTSTEVNLGTEYTFTASTNESVTHTATKDFVVAGEGTVIGTVYDVDRSGSGISDRAIEDANVWAFQKSTFDANANPVIDTGETAYPTYLQQDGATDFFRVVKAPEENVGDTYVDYDRQDIEILDVTQDYRIDNDGQNVNLSISRVRELNTTDASVGSGFAVRSNSANVDPMFVTPLEPPAEGYTYVLERSPWAPNADDPRFANPDSPEEDFSVATDRELVYELNVPNDLTLSAAQDFSEATGQQLWDTTDVQGDYVLDDLFTDFQAGVDYTVVANKVGYEIEFIDPLVTESGAYFEDGGDENFPLRQIDVDPNYVNVTQIGTHPALDEDDEPDPELITEFEDQTDETFQEVPRDGTVDVIQVQTGIEGEDGEITLEGAETTVSFADVVGDAEFLDTVIGGDLVENPDDQTITVDTGDDATATVLFETDQSPTTIETQKIATLVEDSSAVDESNVRFVGVKVLESASISGMVTDSEDTPLPGSPVWAGQFTVDDPATTANPDLVRIEPDTDAAPGTTDFAEAVDDADDEFVVTLEEYNDTVVDGEEVGYEVVNSDTTTAGDLQSYEFTAFPSISAQDSFKLFQFASEDGATYSLEPAPALAGTPTDPDTDYRIRSVRVTGDPANLGTLSNDALVSVQPATTGTANVVIPIVAQDVYELSNLDPEEATVTEGDAPIDVSVDVTNVGALAGDQTLTLTVEDEDGDTVYTDSVDNVIVDPTTSDTVTFEDVPAGDLDAGEYSHIVSSDNDEIAGSLTVQESDIDFDLGDYENEDGVVDTAGLQQAIQDFLDNQISTANLQAVIQAFLSG